MNDSAPAQISNTVRSVFSDPTVAPVALHALRRNCPLNTDDKVTILLPRHWSGQTGPDPHIAYHNGTLRFEDMPADSGGPDARISISNARYVTAFDRHRVESLLTAVDADVITIMIDPSLARNYEKFIYTSAGNVGGFSRLYEDAVVPAGPPTDWPHLLFVNRRALEQAFPNGSMPLAFNEWHARLTAGDVDFRSFRIGGAVMDLQREHAILDLIADGLRALHPGDGPIFTTPRDASMLSDSVRCYGRVLIGGNVRIGNHVVLVGPAILCDNVLLADHSVIKGSIIGAGHCGGKTPLIRSEVIDLGHNHTPAAAVTGYHPAFSVTPETERPSGAHRFRQWPLFSYPRLIKRVADFVTALVVLIMLAPLFPVIALAIKLTSSGPVFFGHKRQGLHAKEFHCLKFRTMIPGADNIQDKLRFKNQVDGPQFKMEDDPRVTAVGRFLRNTYIDEIPQFINVLIGQMSLIGPRPSPKKENSLCPVWHDARLSVRPGMSGLSQIKRTRQPGQDFQEWIHYDMEYVRNLSLKMDLKICWDTVKKIASTFFSQF